MNLLPEDLRRALGGSVASALVVLLAALSTASGSNAAPSTIYVATKAKASAPGTSCLTAKYSSVNAAIAAAAPGATVVVCNGVYRTQVVVSKPVVLAGEHATILATGHANGIVVPASGATVEGFLVKGAIGEGILVVGRPGAPVSGVTVKDNVVVGNDLGNPTGAPLKSSPYAECKAAGVVPGDCGEGIHLMTVVNSVFEDNFVADNSGGFLLSDELGPTAHNRVIYNTVEHNTLDCGITLPSHSTKGFVKGVTVPSAGGVYDNVIEHNTVIGNGVAGQGAGVLLAAGGLGPGGAVYGNVIEYNTISGNGLAGVTVHAHTPGLDLNGNVIEYNTIGTNNVDGDFDFSPHVDPLTTGVVVASTGSPLTITVAHNSISHDTYGIWHTGPVTISGMATNRYAGVVKGIASS
jgi:nitrous oxidase accessory protein NosD